MTWKETHRVSAELASEARIKLSTGNSVAAVELFRAAATSELAALACVDASKPKTYGATAVSAASLLYKAHDLDGAERIACQYIGKGDLPAFAVEQLRDVLNLVLSGRRSSHR